jgi:hypothetical protein
MRIWTALAFTVVCLGGATRARADQRLGLDVGLFSAVGEAGLTYSAEHDVGRIELGLGAGLTGYQLSAMPKLSLGSPSNRYLGGAGLSLSLPTDGKFGRVVWLNVDALGYEHRARSGWSVQVSLGFTYALTNLSRDDDYHISAGFLFPQARLGFGRWF